MSEFYYSSPQVATMFNITLETVRAWSMEFDRHLSPTANPGKNRRRMFAEPDMQVFALVSELKDQGFRFNDIHTALDNGQRGSLAAPPPHEVDTMALANRDQLLNQITRIKAEMDRLNKELAEAREFKDRAIALEARLEETHQRLEKTEERLEEALTTIQELSKEAGEAFAKGFTQGFREAWKNDPNPD